MEIESGSSQTDYIFRFKTTGIVRLEPGQSVKTSAELLAAKHSDSKFIKLKSDGTLPKVQLDKSGKPLEVVLIGHGNATKDGKPSAIGGKNAREISSLARKLAVKTNQTDGIPEKISLVGCNTCNLAKEVGGLLPASIVKGQNSSVKVNQYGKIVGADTLDSNALPLRRRNIVTQLSNNSHQSNVGLPPIAIRSYVSQTPRVPESNLTNSYNKQPYKFKTAKLESKEKRLLNRKLQENSVLYPEILVKRQEYKNKKLHKKKWEQVMVQVENMGPYVEYRRENKLRMDSVKNMVILKDGLEKHFGKGAVEINDNNNFFVNSYSPEKWTMLSNYKDDKNVGYFMSDVVLEQYRVIATRDKFFGNLPSSIISSSIANTQSQNFLKKSQYFPSKERLKGFLGETPNGKYTQRILDAFGMKAMRMKVENLYSKKPKVKISIQKK
ncbi:C80 family cysteine peptidase [Vibrio sp. nBUS_14]|uniref:C80 family cysteine peptidase n=1 Tax=Vibrio sp. nBUS_14 TaxID=3395321 RepID=UPI003EBFBB86